MRKANLLQSLKVLFVPGERSKWGLSFMENDPYLENWRRSYDELESYMADIHEMSFTGESITEPMRTRKEVISWDRILIIGAQLAKIPLNKDEFVDTRTVIGPGAKVPLITETPIFITHMSFGALSKEVKTAMAKGSAAVKTAIGSGEGGILPEEIENAYRYIFEYVPNRYSVTDEILKRVDAIEIKIGQSTHPGMGALLPAKKVTKEIAKVRGYPDGYDIVSPAHYPDIMDREELKKKVTWLREKSVGKPVGIKMAAGHIEEDLDVAISADPDFVTIDGRPGQRVQPRNLSRWRPPFPRSSPSTGRESSSTAGAGTRYP